MRDQDSARSLARGLAWARVGIGAVTFLLPRLSARLMTGPSPDLAAVAFGVRGMGVRAVAVALGALRAGRDREVASWRSAAALFDLADSLGLRLAARRLPLLRGLALLALAIAGAATELSVIGPLEGEGRGPGPAAP